MEVSRDEESAWKQTWVRMVTDRDLTGVTGGAALRGFLIKHLEGVGGERTNDLNKTIQLKNSRLLTQIVHGKCTLGNIAWLSSNQTCSRKDEKHQVWIPL